MSLRQAIASALHVFVVFVFFGAGLFFVLLPSLPLTRAELIDFLTNRYEQCTQIGLGLFLVALFFLLGFYTYNRGRYLVIRMGISADLKVIRQEIESYFAKKFPQKISLKELEISPKAILDLKVQLAPLDEAAREKLFIEVEKHLTIILQERFGYSKHFHLIVNV